jgi:hypothetical protein
MVQLKYILRELLDRLRGSRAACFLPCQSPPPAPAPSAPFIPQPPRLPQKPPIRLPPLPQSAQKVLPLLPPANPTYPREQTAWGLEGGYAPTTSGFETRVFDPPRQAPKVAPQVLAFSIFDGLFEE